MLPVIAFVFFLLGYLIVRAYSGLSWRFLDELFHQCALSLRSDHITLIMRGLSWWGVWGVATSWFIVIVSLSFAKKWRFVLWSLWMSVGGWGLAELLKLLVNRPRPTIDLLATEISRSFPSSHSLTSILLCLSLSYLCFQFSRKFFHSYLLFVFTLLLALAVGASRVYLGVHYLSDVVGGYVLGMGFFSASLWCFRKIK